MGVLLNKHTFFRHDNTIFSVTTFHAAFSLATAAQSRKIENFGMNFDEILIEKFKRFFQGCGYP